MSPKEAFGHIKALYPWVTSIKYKSVDGVACFGIMGTLDMTLVYVDIDWGMTIQYPLPELKWVDAQWPRDAANPPKRARFKNVSRSDWDEGFLVGYDFALSHCWINQGGGRYDRCQVIDEPAAEEITIWLTKDLYAIPIVDALMMIDKGDYHHSRTIHDLAKACRELLKRNERKS